jgi:phosphoribosylamine-glycine ligase
MIEHFVFIAHDCYPLPLAHHLIEEGYDVTVGIIQNYAQMHTGTTVNENPKERAQRLSNHNGMLKKQSLESVFNMLRKVKPKDRDGYFFFFDYSDMYKISEAILKMGFKSGLFPTEYYYKMEKERGMAKAFVEKNYDRVKVAESHSLKKIEEGIELIEESDEQFVLKSNGNLGKTVVPQFEDMDIYRKLMIDTLNKYKKEYEKQGYTLEVKIKDYLEVTPIMVFWNGKPVYSIVEFENKEFGAGNIGAQKGGNQALSIKTDFDAEINKIAFPPAIYDLAKKQPGLSIFDAGLLYDGKEFWFTEFCAMRYGWDGILSEIVMRDDGEPFVGNYFEDITEGVNPCINKYGVSIRLFNYEGNSEETSKPKDDLPVMWDDEIENNLFLYRVEKKGKDIMAIGGQEFFGGVTAGSNSLETAVKEAYERLGKVYFEKLYYRPKFDFLSMDYKSSILNRLEAIKPFMGKEGKDEDAR